MPTTFPEMVTVPAVAVRLTPAAACDCSTSPPFMSTIWNDELERDVREMGCVVPWESTWNAPACDRRPVVCVCPAPVMEEYGEPVGVGTGAKTQVFELPSHSSVSPWRGGPCGCELGIGVN